MRGTMQTIYQTLINDGTFVKGETARAVARELEALPRGEKHAKAPYAKCLHCGRVMLHKQMVKEQGEIYSCKPCAAAGGK